MAQALAEYEYAQADDLDGLAVEAVQDWVRDQPERWAWRATDEPGQLALVDESEDVVLAREPAGHRGDGDAAEDHEVADALGAVLADDRDGEGVRDVQLEDGTVVARLVPTAALAPRLARARVTALVEPVDGWQPDELPSRLEEVPTEHLDLDEEASDAVTWLLERVVEEGRLDEAGWRELAGGDAELATWFGTFTKRLADYVGDKEQVAEELAQDMGYRDAVFVEPSAQSEWSTTHPGTRSQSIEVAFGQEEYPEDAGRDFWDQVYSCRLRDVPPPPAALARRALEIVTLDREEDR